MTNDLVGGFYKSFILRDLTSKIVPGAGALFCAATLLAPGQVILHSIRQATWWEVVGLLSLSWIFSFGLQRVGESIHWILVKPGDMEFDEWIPWHLGFSRNATEQERVIAERYVVIKEACGVSSLALATSLLFLLLGSMFRGSSILSPENPQLLANAFVMLLGVGFSVILRWTHKYYLLRQVETYRAYYDARDNGPDENS
jgi:hypothetical protein